MTYRSHICQTLLVIALLANGDACSAGDRVESDLPFRRVSNQVAHDASPPRLASLILSSELTIDVPEFGVAPGGNLSEKWALPAAGECWPVPGEHSRDLVLLPPVVSDDIASDITPTSQPTNESKVAIDQPIASLLPPLPIELAQQSKQSRELPLKTEDEVPNSTAAAVSTQDEDSQATDFSSAEQKLVDEVIRDSSAATTGVLTDQRINELAKSKIQNAYSMANRGGYYAARQELIEVLRMVSRAKDAKHGNLERTIALAAGLRSLEEAEDFAPRGAQLEADLAIEVICVSHRTPVARQLAQSDFLPRQMMDCYFRYAQLKLATAVTGEPAGSMALHALGKLSSQLGKVEPEKHRLSHRQAVAYQQAALLAHSQNHLAAHELAVLLADAGHFAEAERLLRQVAAREPNAVVLRNLSNMQQKLGLFPEAMANREFARQLAQGGASGTNNVQWLSPEAFAHSGGAAPGMSTAIVRPHSVQPAITPQRAPAPGTMWR